MKPGWENVEVGDWVRVGSEAGMVESLDGYGVFTLRVPGGHLSGNANVHEVLEHMRSPRRDAVRDWRNLASDAIDTAERIHSGISREWTEGKLESLHKRAAALVTGGSG